MQSIRSRLIIGLIKNRHLFQGKRERDRVDGSFSLAAFRERIDRASVRMKLPREVRSEETVLNRIRGEWLIPDEVSSGRTLLYIHGGGFVSGSCLTHRMHVAKFAKALGMRALVFDYRLAPEHPFPAALEDCLDVYHSLLGEGMPPEEVVLGGESAGGTLVLSLILALQAKALPLPGRAFAISPLVDFQCTADSFTRNASRDIALIDSWHLWGNDYRRGHDITDPLLSPLFGDFSRTPPLLLMVGTHEVHFDDVRELVRRIGEQGGAVTYSEWPRMVHAFPIMAPLFPEASRALEEIGRFARD